MKPINSSERARVYYKVIGLFIACLVLAMSLGFSTMNVNKLTDYASRKQLEVLKSNLMFQEKVFQPNINEATVNLKDLPDYKAKQKYPGDISTSIEVSLGNIKSAWKTDETDQNYIMYKNIVDIYFALEAAYMDKFKLEEQLEQKDRITQNVDGDLSRELKIRDNFAKENETLKNDIKNIGNDLKEQQRLAESRQRELKSCRDSLKTCLRDVKIYKQQR